MSLADSHKKHGSVVVAFDAAVVSRTASLVLEHLERSHQPPVAHMAVAATLVLLQTRASGDTLDNTIELLREFIDIMCSKGQA